MFKALAALALLIFAGGYFAGAFGPNSSTPTVSRPPAEVMAEGARSIMRVHAFEAELRRNGRNTNDDGAFRPVEQRMAPTDAAPSGAMSAAADD